MTYRVCEHHSHCEQYSGHGDRHTITREIVQYIALYVWIEGEHSDESQQHAQRQCEALIAVHTYIHIYIAYIHIHT